jgi:hypothetical protein
MAGIRQAANKGIFVAVRTNSKATILASLATASNVEAVVLPMGPALPDIERDTDRDAKRDSRPEAVGLV